MKSRLIILSDLWGVKKSEWITYYLESLNSDFDIKYYDCCSLGEINTSNLKEHILHHQFVSGGIQNAAEKLLELETEKVDILAFNIGGTIAWKAGLNGLNINNLYAISSTRLRYETKKPICSIKLVFGENDEFKPNSNWFKKIGVISEVIKDGEHQIYTNKVCALKICQDLITNNNTIKND